MASFNGPFGTFGSRNVFPTRKWTKGQTSGQGQEPDPGPPTDSKGFLLETSTSAGEAVAVICACTDPGSGAAEPEPQLHVGGILIGQERWWWWWGAAGGGRGVLREGRQSVSSVFLIHTKK